jgi:hypothetical protein
MVEKLTPRQMELLVLLGRGPRYGFTDLRLVKALEAKGLARNKKAKNMAGEDWMITAAGRRLLPKPRRFDQSTSQNCPGFVEAFRVMP